MIQKGPADRFGTDRAEDSYYQYVKGTPMKQEKSEITCHFSCTSQFKLSILPQESHFSSVMITRHIRAGQTHVGVGH